MFPKKIIQIIPVLLLVISPFWAGCTNSSEPTEINYCQWYAKHDLSALPFGAMTKQDMVDWLMERGISQFYDEKPNRKYETGVSWRNEEAYFIAWFHRDRLSIIIASHNKAEGRDVLSCLGNPAYYSIIPFRGPEGGGWSIILWYPERGIALEGFVHEQNEMSFQLTYFFKPNNIEKIVRDQILIVPQWADQPLEDILPHIKPWPGDFSQIQ